MPNDTAFQMAASNIRFGPGTTREIGMDLADMGVKRTLVVIDPALIDRAAGQTVFEALEAGTRRLRRVRRGQHRADRLQLSTRHRGLRPAGGMIRSSPSVVAARLTRPKAANLYSSYPADFFDYVNAPIGKGKPVPGPCKPLIAVPTTAGTGSETTGVAIFDWLEKKAKTGIAHRYLKPTLGIIDSDNTRTLPAAVAAATGLDVLSHALEIVHCDSLHAAPASRRVRSNGRRIRGTIRSATSGRCGALELVAEFLPRAVADTTDDEARSQMLLAAAIAGIGFGNAGVHLPHGMSYPVAGMVRDYRPARICDRSRARPARDVG